ncbi:MAG: histidinol dehydrogenase [Dethiobacter sp.]|jgi:histidinol dehydrogenase|nr:histidinol dehydrogenase [Dethiobacter sp.]MBS3897217.1 histidinol dehydrogenase [Dethiobacter sp.]MBS3982459.1 histidinol dehydrogenase [Dethiobacter sp.]MCL4462541.1 histidinol dehydrogenase [Bacillota bacterium]MCL5993169.1 histidinol dehydrogenase [Bacillota bacterium]
MLREFNAKSFRENFVRRGFADFPAELAAVRAILAAVRQNGDRAVRQYTQQFDGAALELLRVGEDEFAAAEAAVEPAAREALLRAAENIRAYHLRQLQSSWLEVLPDGVALGQRLTAVDSVGAYVPGGGAAYPSSVLMTVLPARVAGVREVVVVTPPKANGEINPYILLAAKIAGADAVFKCGGAQAVAALAYGTESIPRVDKIVGPGNIYVTLAKREVYGDVGIDLLAGPSEVLVVADETARADFVAADLLSQAEHDLLAAAYLLTTSRRLAADVQRELAVQSAKLERCDVARQALMKQGALVLVDCLEEAFAIVNMLAPEHLELQVADPWAALGKVQNAGAVFLGAYTPEPVGDYWAGANHVLPTAGAARFASVLSVADFMKKMSVVYYPPQALLEASKQIEALARVEGLQAHGQAVKIRREFLEKTGGKHHT